MKVSLNWLKDYIPIKGSAEALAYDLTMAGLEVKKITPFESDVVMEAEITTNRPDWLSHLGVAREIFAVRGGRFSTPPFKCKNKPKTTRTFKVSTKDSKLKP